MAGKYKELKIINADNSALYALKFVGGGELPDMLKSNYTSQTEAAKARDLYYAGKITKKKEVA